MVSQQIIANHTETVYGRIFLHENGVVYIYFRDCTPIDLKVAQTLVDDVRALDDSGQTRLLVVQGKNNDMSFEAQHFLGTVHGVSHLALVVHNRLQAEVAKFFVSFLVFLRSSYEMRVFSQLKPAETWLLRK